jgi:hypothetical protein
MELRCERSVMGVMGRRRERGSGAVMRGSG